MKKNNTWSEETRAFCCVLFIIKSVFLHFSGTVLSSRLFCQCAVGSRVAMRVGGDFYFDPLPSGPAVDLLLVAGGVGINPLYSILLHTSDLLRLNQSSAGRHFNIGSAHLCYSAKNTQELLFEVHYVFHLEWECLE